MWFQQIGAQLSPGDEPGLWTREALHQGTCEVCVQTTELVQPQGSSLRNLGQWAYVNFRVQKTHITHLAKIEWVINYQHCCERILFLHKNFMHLSSLLSKQMKTCTSMLGRPSTLEELCVWNVGTPLGSPNHCSFSSNHVVCVYCSVFLV